MSATARTSSTIEPLGGAASDAALTNGLSGVVTSAPLVVVRWFKFGKRRLYVNTANDVGVGWVDLETGDRSLAMPELEAAFEAAIAAAQVDIPEPYAPRRVLDVPPPSIAPRRASDDPLLPPTSPPASHPMADSPPPVEAAAPPAPQPPPLPTWTDLAGNVAGQAARARAQAELAELRDRKGPFMTFLTRGLDIKTGERSWRIGADGEESVGARLEKLRTSGWRLLHSVPVGKRGSDIDHVLIGPGGVYVLNTKNHPKGNVWVSKTTVMVNGHSQPYLRNSRFEADRAAKFLSGAVGWQVEVAPVLVFLTDTFIPQVTVKDKPEGVIILDRLDLPRYFRKRTPRLSASQVEEVFEFARRSSTWG